MTILRMSVSVLSFALSTNVFSQANPQSSYKCSSGTSLKGGSLVYQTGDMQAVAKHVDGTISEILGIMGKFEGKPAPVSWDEKSYNTYLINTMNSGATVPGVLDVPQGVPKDAITPSQPVRTEEEALDRNDIETTRNRSSESQPAQILGNRPGDIAARQLRPGDVAALQPRAGDLAARQPKNGNQVAGIHSKAITFSARLDSRGNISEITYRKASAPTSLWRAGALNSEDATSVYMQLNSELSQIKSRAYCCTNNPGASCGAISTQANPQYSLRTEKTTIGQRIRSAWSDMINAFRASSSSEAK